MMAPKPEQVESAQSDESDGKKVSQCPFAHAAMVASSASSPPVAVAASKCPFAAAAMVASSAPSPADASKCPFAAAAMVESSVASTANTNNTPVNQEEMEAHLSSAAAAASSKCPFVAAPFAIAARVNTNNMTTSTVNEEEAEELRKFLELNLNSEGKFYFYNVYTDLSEKVGIKSIDALASSTVEDLSSKVGLPETIARLLIKKACESIVAGYAREADLDVKKKSIPATENFAPTLASTPSSYSYNKSTDKSLKEFLEKNGKEKFHDKLIEAKYTTLQKIALTSVEDLASKASLPKTIAGLLNKKALKQMEVGGDTAVKEEAVTISLKEFLEKNGKGKFCDQLVASNIKTVKDLSVSTVDLLSRAGFPNTIARVLIKKAKEEIEEVQTKDSEDGKPIAKANFRSSYAPKRKNTKKQPPVSPTKEKSTSELAAYWDFAGCCSLREFLKKNGKGKEEVRWSLVSANFNTVEDLSLSTVEALSAKAELPETVALVLIRKAKEQMKKDLENANKPKPSATFAKGNFAAALAATSTKNAKVNFAATLAETASTSAKANFAAALAAPTSNDPLPMAGDRGTTVASASATDCNQATAVVDLKIFLEQTGKEKFHDKLIGASINTVEQLAASSVEDLPSKAGLPKTIARLLIKKATEQTSASSTSSSSTSVAPMASAAPGCLFDHAATGSAIPLIQATC